MSSLVQSISAEYPVERLIGAFDRWGLRLDSGGVMPIVRALDRYRARVPVDTWRETVDRLRAHPVFERFQEDPYTSWGFRKPRGYAGDAVLLDFIYGAGDSARRMAEGTPLGQSLYRELMRHPASVALRARREFLSKRLASILESVRQPRILAVACGHLREADSLPQPVARPARFVAFDQDAESLRIARSDHPALSPETVCESVLAIVRGAKLGVFDYIYSAGLYDYLSDDFARRLTTKLAAMLAPGGRLLIANMMPLSGAAYMEAVMDWWLIYRTIDEFTRVCSSLTPEYQVKPFTRRYVAYLEITR